MSEGCLSGSPSSGGCACGFWGETWAVNAYYRPTKGSSVGGCLHTGGDSELGCRTGPKSRESVCEKRCRDLPSQAQSRFARDISHCLPGPQAHCPLGTACLLVTCNVSPLEMTGRTRGGITGLKILDSKDVYPE